MQPGSDTAVDRDGIGKLVVFDQLLQAAEGARMGFHADHLSVSSHRARKSKDFFARARADIEDHISRLGLVIPPEHGSCPRVEARRVQPDVGLVIGEIAVRRLMDPNTVVGDPLHTVSRHDCELIGNH